MKTTMRHRSHLPPAERQAVARLHSLLQHPGLLHGSLQVKLRRCGKPSCHCSRGERHPSLRLYIVQKGRQISLHVPAVWQTRVRAWIDRDREIRKLLLHISTRYAEKLRQRKE